MRYAMVLESTVIDVISNHAVIPQWPPSPDGEEVTAVECDDSIYIGMLYIDGEFREPEIPKPELAKPYKPTAGELVIMEIQATIYEEMSASVLASAEATAEIYEAILLMGGNA